MRPDFRSAFAYALRKTFSTKGFRWFAYFLLGGLFGVALGVGVVAVLPEDQNLLIRYAARLAAGLVVALVLGLLTVALIRDFMADVVGDMPLDSPFGASAPLYRQSFYYVIATALYYLIWDVGIFALVIPAVYAGVALRFYGLFIALEDEDPLAGLKSSWQFTRGRVGTILLFLLPSVTVRYLQSIVEFVNRLFSTATPIFGDGFPPPLLEPLLHTASLVRPLLDSASERSSLVFSSEIASGMVLLIVGLAGFFAFVFETVLLCYLYGQLRTPAGEGFRDA